MIRTKNMHNVTAFSWPNSQKVREVGIPAEHKIRSPENFETTCNPMLQADLLNEAQTAFNVLVGLCIGHDMLFTMHSRSPVTTLIVKDRLSGHNPVVSLYTRYHRNLV